MTKLRSRLRLAVLTVATMAVAYPGTAQEFDDTYVGRTGQGRSFSFTVVNDRVTDLSFGMFGDGVFCDLSVTVTASLSPGAPIVGNSFSVSLPGTLSFSIRGTFESFSEVSGTLSMFDLDDCFIIELTSWTALGDVKGTSVSIGDATLVEGDSGPASANFLVSVEPAPAQQVSVGYTTRDGNAEGGSDFVPTSGVLIVHPGETSGTVVVEMLPDSIAEFTETLFVDIFDVVGPGARIFDSTGLGTIVDDDGPPAALGFVEATFDGVDGVDGLDGAISVAVSPDDQHVYVAGAGDDSVALFMRDLETGALSFVEAVFDGVDGVDGLDSVRSVTVSPDGRHVYAASGVDDSVAVFTRDLGTGTLSFVEAQFDGVGGVDGLDNALSVDVSPDGQHVYVASFRDDSVAVFARDTEAGALSFVEAVFDGVDGVDGLDGASSVTVSPDGSHVYVASYFDDSVAVLARNPTTGALSFVEAQFDGVGGVQGLSFADSVAVSPDGNHVYVVSDFEDAVVAFSRDRSTGSLSFVEAEFDVLGGGLDGATSVVVSRGGRHVFVASDRDNAVAVFERNPLTGSLRFVGAQFDGAAGVDGLDRAASVTVSPDGRHVYVASLGDDAVAVFSTVEIVLPSAGFMFSPPNPQPGEEIRFIDTSSGEPTSWSWSFGDGATSTEQNPTHTYAETGDYTVALTVSNSAGSDSSSRVVTVVNVPEANFVWSPPSPLADEEIRFTDASSGEPTAWSWSFSDGTTSTEQNPTHTYAEVGDYTVTLTVSNSAGSDSLSRVVTVEEATACDSGATALCLNERRFMVEVDWRDFAGNTGSGQVVPFGSDDSGLFYFFAPENWEMLVKVLDGCGITDHFWVFAAATTNVEYTLRVTDTQTEVVMEYFNPLGNASAAITDTSAFATCSARSAASAVGSYGRVVLSAPPPTALVRDLATSLSPKQSTCLASSSNLCLNQGRFRIEVDWTDFQGGTGSAQVVPFGSDDSGLLYFFTPDNWEMLVKVLDGCGITDHFWVFAAATTNVRYTLRVTDTETGTVMEYFNPLGNAAAAITDTSAFATCP